MIFRAAAPSLLALAALWPGWPCRPVRRSPAPAPATAPQPASEVAATLDGAPISLAELDERAKNGLVRVRQQEYELRKQALDDLIGERLLEKEAKSRGIGVEQLLKDEVDRQVPAPDPAQVARSTSRTARASATGRAPRWRRRSPGSSMDRARAGYREAFTNGLREKAQVAVSLEPPRAAVVSPTSAPTLGPEGARVTIVAFADFQCPYCQRAQGVIDQVMKAYSGKVQLVHRDFPLDGHPQAFVAARAARCAGEQGRYWEYHRSLMMDRGDMSEADLRSGPPG